MVELQEVFLIINGVIFTLFTIRMLSRKNNILLLTWSIIILWVIIWVLVNSNLLFKKDIGMCWEAIKTYLQNADKSGVGQTAKKWDTVIVDYIGRLGESEIFDTSIESIARDCGKYTQWRDYESWLEFLLWGGQMIPGFDTAVEWMKIGQTTTISIWAADAYGERDEEKIIKLPKENIANSDNYKKWDKIVAWNVSFLVYDVTDTDLLIDTNHELAWKTLIFDITLKNIK